MRSTAAPIVLAALLAGCGDKPSAAGRQGEGSAPVAAAASDEVPAASAPTTPAPAGRIDRAHRGEAGPTLGFTDPAGKPVTLARYRGTPVLLNLWATWCGPCVREMPQLDALAAARGKTLRVVTLSQDLDPAKARAFIKDRRFAHLEAWTDAQMRWAAAFGGNLPTTILYDKSGREVWRTQGLIDWEAQATQAAIDEAKA